MVENKDDNAVMYGHSEMVLGSLRIVKCVDFMIYIGDTDMVDGHSAHAIENIIYIQIYLLIRIDRLDLEVKP
jgi:hypothetical protein